MRETSILLASAIFCGGGKKGSVRACARFPGIRVDIFRVLARSLPLYSRICTTDDGCLRMLLPIVSEQTLYKTRVDALCTCTYVAMLHVHIVRTSKLVYFSGYVFRTLRLYVNRNILLSCACANRLYQAVWARADYTRPSALMRMHAFLALASTITYAMHAQTAPLLSRRQGNGRRECWLLVFYLGVFCKNECALCENHGGRREEL